MLKVCSMDMLPIFKLYTLTGTAVSQGLFAGGSRAFTCTQGAYPDFCFKGALGYEGHGLNECYTVSCHLLHCHLWTMDWEIQRFYQLWGNFSHYNQRANIRPNLGQTAPWNAKNILQTLTELYIRHVQAKPVRMQDPASKMQVFARRWKFLQLF